MEATRSLRLRLLAQNGLFVVLLCALVMLLAYLAREYRSEWDVTRGARNTLSAATLEVLGALKGPLDITAYAIRVDGSGANVHQRLEERLHPYQRAKPDIALRFVDPREELVGVLMVQTSNGEIQREFEDLVAQSVAD